jgi:tRNA (uracil-5-)-methyltransferase
VPLSRVQPAAYEALLAQKVEVIKSKFADFRAPAPCIYPSSPNGFRLRAEFRIWHEGDRVDYVMFRKEEPKVPVIVEEFPIAEERIQLAMKLLRGELNASAVLRRKLFQVEFMASLSGELLLTLVYHRQLDQAWEQEALLLAAKLQEAALPASIIGRSRKQKLVIGRDFLEEVLPVHGIEYQYRQYEQSFTQPNGLVNIHMIEWACSQASQMRGDLLELYCGNGNFTFPLARYFNHVIATELSKVSTRAALATISSNNITNVQLIRLSAEEVTQAMNGVRPFRRLQQLPQPLHDYELNTLFVDPPRSGLDQHTVAMAARFPSIIYISCNPDTLVENLRLLQASHTIEQFALFDQFPYTDHMECGVLLKQRGA